MFDPKIASKVGQIIYLSAMPIYSIYWKETLCDWHEIRQLTLTGLKLRKIKLVQIICLLFKDWHGDMCI